METTNDLRAYLSEFYQEELRPRELDIPPGFVEFLPKEVRENRGQVSSIFATFFFSILDSNPRFYLDWLAHENVSVRSSIPNSIAPKEKMVIPMGNGQFGLLFLVPKLPNQFEEWSSQTCKSFVLTIFLNKSELHRGIFASSSGLIVDFLEVQIIGNTPCIISWGYRFSLYQFNSLR
jgi:hypothetical protein